MKIDEIFSGTNTDMGCLTREEISICVNRFYTSVCPDVERNNLIKFLNESDIVNLFWAWNAATSFYVGNDKSPEILRRVPLLKMFAQGVQERLMKFVTSGECDALYQKLNKE